jgi:hypothetical protein
MSAICPSVSDALARNSNYLSLPPPFLWRERTTNSSWRSRVFGWVKSLFGSYARCALVEPTKRTSGPEEPPGESELVNCMNDPVFWTMVLMH